MTYEEKAEKKINVPKDVYLRNIFCCDCSLKKTCENDPCENYEHWKEGYEKGLAEGKPKWHDLRKDPNDLPKKTGEYFTNIGLLYYDELCNRHFWHTPSCEACDYSDKVEEDEVIAWCELPKFEEKINDSYNCLSQI